MENDTRRNDGAGSPAGGDGFSGGGQDGSDDGAGPTEQDKYGIIGVAKLGWRMFATLAETGRLANHVGGDQLAVEFEKLDGTLLGIEDIIATLRIGLRAERLNLLTRPDSNPGFRPGGNGVG